MPVSVDGAITISDRAQQLLEAYRQSGDTQQIRGQFAGIWHCPGGMCRLEAALEKIELLEACIVHATATMKSNLAVARQHYLLAYDYASEGPERVKEAFQEAGLAPGLII